MRSSKPGGPGTSMNSAPAVKALRGAAAAGRLGRP